MKIAVEGCAHGELETIYETIKYLEESGNFKVDLLICCGDFQASRNEEDLRSMAVPAKYNRICSFYKYYTGEKIAPVLTIFIGGNHEASVFLQELPYGGWVAPNIYYLGYASVINIAGIRIGGLSGIYKGQDYMKGHFERSPYDDSTKRSVYHVRHLEVFRLKQLSGTIDIFLSHDWPRRVWEYGNKKQLLNFKPYFAQDINSGELGSRPGEELLHSLKPNFWFAAHLHCKFAALIPHENGTNTKFLALDKCLPKRRFLQIVNIPHDSNLKIEICYDLEWLTILRLTNHLLSVKRVLNFLPGPSSLERYSFTPTEEEKLITLESFGNNLIVPQNFEKTASGYCSNISPTVIQHDNIVFNPQTILFCKTLSIDDPIKIIMNVDYNQLSTNMIDDNDIDNSVGNLTFIDDSDLIINSVEDRSTLRLPSPVNTSCNNAVNPAIAENLEAEESFQPQNNGVQQEPKLDESCEEMEVEVPTPEKEIDHKLEITKKVFKRRNASLYVNTESLS